MNDGKKCLFRKLKAQIRDERVLWAMEQIPRERFISTDNQRLAYDDIALPIGESQTISQPLIVAMMTSALELTGSERVLEVGTGSGYQAAVLSLLVPSGKVITVERVPSLAKKAAHVLLSLGYLNVEAFPVGSVLGCPNESPFDAVIVTAASPRLPSSLLDQLEVGGRMVIPVGSLLDQNLVRVVKTSEGISLNQMGPCRFVPLIGEEAWPAER